MVSTIQAILFDRIYWTRYEAETWLLKHNLYPIKNAHLTQNEIRFRLKNPDEFSRFRTKKIKHGIKLVMGFY